MSREISIRDSYKDKVYKLIPAEAVAFYLFIMILIEHIKFKINYSDYTSVIQFFFSLIMILSLPVYLVQYHKILRGMQLVFTTIGFFLWTISFDKN